MKGAPVNAIPPIRRQVLVAADPATAFETFTKGIGRWWPLTDLSVFGPGATVAFVDHEIVERSADGQRAVWGSVTRWDPGRALAFTWHPGKTPTQASQVEVTFEASEESATMVTLEHRGWEVFADPEGARSEYDQGWPTVLGHYRAHSERPADEGDTWVALWHRPGPAAPGQGLLFDDPRFANHVAFLEHMRDAGYLVAAGPLTDAAGEGMTVLRLPGPGQVERATQLATEQDASVVAGFLSVTVRPWQVMLEA
jgi:uncharacterized protein YciI